MRYEQIWLVGFSGTGKSRIARPLAAALNWAAVDLDKLIEETSGQTIQQIFKSGGEAAFRVMESTALEDVAKTADVVVATGGGSILAESNREAMRRRGFIVCLDARPDTILARLRSDGVSVEERPLLEGDAPLQKILEMKTERQPLYANADFILQTDELTPDQVTHQILVAYRERSAAVPGGAA